MLIKIIDIPTGEAPIEIRQDWVGVIMNVDEEETQRLQGGRGFGLASGVLGGKPDPDNFYGYAIETTVAISALVQTGKKEAAQFWDDHSLKMGFSHLVFGRKFCEVVEALPG